MAATTPRAPDMAAPLVRYVAWLVAGFGLTTAAANLATDGLGVGGLQPRRNAYRAEILWAYNDLPDPADVVVVGSSRVAGGLHGPFIEEALEKSLGRDISVFEMGIAGLRVEWLRYMVEEVFLQRPPRGALVLAVETRFFAYASYADRRGGPAGEWDELSPAVVLEDAFGGLRDLYNIEWLLHSSTRAARDKRQQNSGDKETWQEKVDRDERDRKRRAAAARDDADGTIADPFTMGRLAWNWPEPDDRTLWEWRESLDLLAQLPCPVVFVRMPLEPGFDAAYMPEAHAGFERDVIDAVRARGWPFHDLQGPGWNDDPSWFISKTHLGVKGAAPVSRRLAREVLAPLLPQH